MPPESYQKALHHQAQEHRVQRTSRDASSRTSFPLFLLLSVRFETRVPNAPTTTAAPYPPAVYHAHDYICTGYLGGNDTRFVTKESQKRFAERQGDNEHFHSMYACLVPYQRTAYPNPIDITGSFYDRVRGEKDRKILHYATAPFYSHYWDWNNEQQESPNEAKYTSDRSIMNTICFQGHQVGRVCRAFFLTLFYRDRRPCCCGSVRRMSRNRGDFRKDPTERLFSRRQRVRTRQSSRTRGTGAATCTPASARCARAWRAPFNRCTIRKLTEARRSRVM